MKAGQSVHPGETEADFAKLLAFVKEARFDHGPRSLLKHGFCRIRITAAGPYDLEADPVKG